MKLNLSVSNYSCYNLCNVHYMSVNGTKYQNFGFKRKNNSISQSKSLAVYFTYSRSSYANLSSVSHCKQLTYNRICSFSRSK